MHPVPASGLLPGTLDWSCLPAVCLLASHHTSCWQGPQLWIVTGPTSPPLLRWTVSQELAGWREAVSYGQENLHAEHWARSREGAVLTELLTGLAWQTQDTPKHVVIVSKREGLFNLCQTSCTVNFTMVCLPLHARHLVLWPAR